MKPGDRVGTPHGTGTIIGFKNTTTWYMKGPRNRQLVVVQYDDNPRRQGHWFPDKIKEAQP